MTSLFTKVRHHGVAYLALFLALAAGTAWALERNSVRSKHIAPNAVGDSELKDAKAKPVKANTATSSASDPCSTGDSGVFCGYDEGAPDDGRWENVGAGFADVTYRKDPGGAVQLSGVGTVNSFQTGLQVFRVPRAMRPAGTHLFGASCREAPDGAWAPCRVSVDPDGAVRWVDGAFPRHGMSLDGISYPAD